MLGRDGSLLEQDAKVPPVTLKLPWPWEADLGVDRHTPREIPTHTQPTTYRPVQTENSVPRRGAAGVLSQSACCVGENAARRDSGCGGCSQVSRPGWAHPKGRGSLCRCGLWVWWLLGEAKGERNGASRLRTFINNYPRAWCWAWDPMGTSRGPAGGRAEKRADKAKASVLRALTGGGSPDSDGAQGKATPRPRVRVASPNSPSLQGLFYLGARKSPTTHPVPI